MSYILNCNSNYESVLILCRYMIPRYTDVEQFFSINSEDGMITTTRPLDREAQAWHNISVSATEIGMYVYIHKDTSPNLDKR